MAQVINNDLMSGLSGKLGKRLVLRHMRDGRTFMLTRPDFSEREFSEKQLSHQSRFQQASAYARVASREEPRYAVLAAGSGKGAYHLALADWFHPPVIEQVTRQAGCIRVYATDNVQVVRVRITISDEVGNLLEQGQAVSSAEGCWEYATATEGCLSVEAFDLAGNVAKQEL